MIQKKIQKFKKNKPVAYQVIKTGAQLAVGAAAGAFLWGYIIPEIINADSPAYQLYTETERLVHTKIGGLWGAGAAVLYKLAKR